MTDHDPASLFLRYSAEYLERDFLPRIERAIASLSDSQFWWRPNHSSNSIANLLLHLSGNVRQWILSGIAGEPDRRKRQKEFDTRGGMTKEEISAQLRSTVIAAASVLRSLDSGALTARRHIQGNDVTVLEAVYHVVEHFSMHTGQIIYIAKQLADRDLEMYTFPGGAAHKNW